MPRPAPTRPAPRESHGARRRRQILAAAADLGSAEGLEGLSIGRLAAEVGMSKGGLAAHFDSKEQLQLAALEEAAAAYGRELLGAAGAAEAGLPRLRALMEAWIDFIDRIDYRGGCFFAAAGAEFASRPGAVRERVAHHTRSWTLALEREARTAARLGELRPGSDPRLLSFALHALVQEANLRRHLLDDAGAFDDARALLASLLRDAARKLRARRRRA